MPLTSSRFTPIVSRLAGARTGRIIEISSHMLGFATIYLFFPFSVSYNDQSFYSRQVGRRGSFAVRKNFGINLYKHSPILLRISFMKKSQLLALYSLLLVALLASSAAQANAQTFFNLGVVDGEETLGSRLNASLGADGLIATDSDEGVNFTVTATSREPNDPNGDSFDARFFASNATAGVDSIGLDAGDRDARTGIDPFETLTFMFTFDSDITLDLVSIDFSGIGGDETDAARVQIADGDSFLLFDGQEDFLSDDDDSIDDLYTPSEPISISSGDIIIFSRDDPGTSDISNYQLQGLTLNIGTAAAVPEPSSILMLGLGSVLTLVRRRRS